MGSGTICDDELGMHGCSEHRWWKVVKSYPGRGRGVSARMGGDNVLIAGWRERVDDR